MSKKIRLSGDIVALVKVRLRVIGAEVSYVKTPPKEKLRRALMEGQYEDITDEEIFEYQEILDVEVFEDE